eukprot:Platyproteum_vivax@DN7500_c0_g1_i6.p1
MSSTFVMVGLVGFRWPSRSFPNLPADVAISSFLVLSCWSAVLPAFSLEEPSGINAEYMGAKGNCKSCKGSEVVDLGSLDFNQNKWVSGAVDTPMKEAMKVASEGVFAAASGKIALPGHNLMDVYKSVTVSLKENSMQSSGVGLTPEEEANVHFLQRQKGQFPGTLSEADLQEMTDLQNKHILAQKEGTAKLSPEEEKKMKDLQNKAIVSQRELSSEENQIFENLRNKFKAQLEANQDKQKVSTSSDSAPQVVQTNKVSSPVSKVQTESSSPQTSSQAVKPASFEIKSDEVKEKVFKLEGDTTSTDKEPQKEEEKHGKQTEPPVVAKASASVDELKKGKEPAQNVVIKEEEVVTQKKKSGESAENKEVKEPPQKVVIKPDDVVTQKMKAVPKKKKKKKKKKSTLR